MNLPLLGIIENMSSLVCPCCNEISELWGQGGARKLAEEFQIPFLGSLPLDPALTSVLDGGEDPYIKIPDSITLKTAHKIVEKLMEGFENFK
jgi:ATP-binding protein involved in chromosome partitioning